MQACRMGAIMYYKTDTLPVTSHLHDILLNYHPSRQLGSSSAHQFLKPVVTSNLASQVVCVCIPSMWNSLKPDLFSTDFPGSFESHLKTTLFLTACRTT